MEYKLNCSLLLHCPTVMMILAKQNQSYIVHYVAFMSTYPVKRYAMNKRQICIGRVVGKRQTFRYLECYIEVDGWAQCFKK